MLRFAIAAAALSLALTGMAQAATTSPMSHNTMSHSTKKKSAMAHSAMGHSTMKKSAMGHSAMGHSTMKKSAMAPHKTTSAMSKKTQ